MELRELLDSSEWNTNKHHPKANKLSKYRLNTNAFDV